MLESDGGYDQKAALVDKLIATHPRSLYCAASVLTLCQVLHGQGNGWPDAQELFLQCLDRMKRAGATGRSRVVVLFALAGDEPANDGQDYLTGRVLACREVAGTTTFAYEKRWALLKSADLMSQADDDRLLGRARQEYREFLKAYPGPPWADRARFGIVRTYLTAEQPDDALAAMREIKRGSPRGTLFVSELFAISKAYAKAEQPGRALAVLEEVEARYPHSPAVAEAALGVGQALVGSKDEAGRVAAYRRAVEKPTTENPRGPLGLRATRETAFAALGDHYQRKQEWEEALRCRLETPPHSFCGNCLAMSQARWEAQVAECLSHLAANEPLLGRLEAKVLTWDVGCAPLAVWVVDRLRRRGVWTISPPRRRMP